MRQRYIQETALADAVKLIQAVVSQNKDELEKFKNTKYKSSISTDTKDLIMTFPLIYDSAIATTTASMISKAHEKKCLSLLHLLCTAEWATESRNAKEFMANFHKNIDIGSFDMAGNDCASVDDFIAHSDELEKEFKNVFKESGVDAELLALLKEDNGRWQRCRSFPVESINELSIQDYMVIPTYYGKKEVRLNEAKKSSGESRQGGADFMDDKKMELKKANELMPSLLVINFRGVKEENGKESTAINVRAVIGVKSRLIATSSYDIIEHVFIKNNGNNFLGNLVRATTREISFVRDFLLGLSKAKADALATSRRGSTSRMWKTLEVRSTRSSIKKALRQQNNAMAITGLMISMEDVDQLRKNHNINLMNVYTAKKIMESYNLLALIVVDESTESAMFLYDGDDVYETLSFNSLQKDSADGGMYKKVINMMSKMM